jgi:VWFA-related protein
VPQASRRSMRTLTTRRLKASCSGFLCFSLFVSGLPAISSVDIASRSRQWPGETPGLQHRVTVSLKLVQVIVTDRKGRPVTDLEKDDFAVTDNGTERRITDFERHVLPLPPVAAAPVSEPTKAATKTGSPGALLARKFYILLDTVFADVNGFRSAKAAVLRFIEKDLRPEDEVGILSFNGGGTLSVASSLSRDHHAALAAVGSLALGELMSRIAPEDGGDDDDFGRVVTGSSDAKGNSFAIGASPLSADARLVAGNFIWSMRALAQTLRYEAGLKCVILCSKGIKGKDIGRGEYAYGRNTDLSRDYEEMCREIAAANISIYPINTADTTIGFQQIDKADWKESKTGVPFLREFASHTGGRFLGPARNAPELMDRLQALTGSYYVLGYPVSEAWDGKYHAVRVNVRRSGVEVQAQPGYFDPKLFAAYSKIEREIDLVDLALADDPMSQDPIRFGMTLWPTASIPPGNIGALAQISTSGLGDAAGERVEFSTLLFDAMDRIVDSSRSELRLDAAGLGTNRAFLAAKLSAPPGRYRCRIVLRNLESGRAAVAGSDLVLPAPDPGKILIFPPLFVVPTEGKSLYLGPVNENAAGDVHGERDRGGEILPFDPASFSPRPEGPAKSGSSLYAVLPVDLGPKGGAPPLRLLATIADESAGTESPLPLFVIREKDGPGTELFFVKLDLPELEWGAYVLTFIVEDGADSRSARLTRVISVE